MGLNIEFGRAVEEAFTPTLSELASRVNVEKVMALGTFLSRRQIGEYLKFLVRTTRYVEALIRSGDKNVPGRQSYLGLEAYRPLFDNSGYIPLFDNRNGEVSEIVVRGIANAAGYNSELDPGKVSSSPTPPKCIFTRSEPMKAGEYGITLLHPLPGARALGPKGEVWQAVIFRTLGPGGGTFGLAYMADWAIKQA
ncbi:hypothetical protein HYU93_00785 [Candidatus Daviesbacteria bacterium]|nr:hypothetical protein [Candidatus Daviesbacteria bacterium]